MSERIAQNPFINDLQTIQNHYQETIAPRDAAILQWRGDASSVRDWYFSRDPLGEYEILCAVVGRGSYNPDLIVKHHMMMKRESLLLERGAAALVASTCLPEVFEDGPDHWFEKVAEKIARTKKSVPLVDESEEMNSQAISTFCLQSKHPQKKLTLEDMENLHIAAESYFSLYYPAGFGVYETSTPEVTKTVEIMKNRVSRNLGYKIFDLIQQSGIGRLSPDIKMRLMALRSAYTGYGFGFNEPLEGEFLKQMQKLGLLSMTNDLKKVFLGDQGILNLNGTKDIRGILHEFVWYLDANMYLRMNGMDDVVVKPSSISQDRPAMGRTGLNRGFDYLVLNNRTRLHKMLQLKSTPNPRHHKNYHPMIVPVHEQNFLDFNPNRLAKKIAVYQEFIRNDMPERGRSEVMKYLLPSVPEAVHISDNIPDILNRWSISENVRTSARPGMRKERRAAQAQLRKLEKKIRRRGL